MHFFGMLFWLAMFWFALKAFRTWNSGGRYEYRGDRRLNRREASSDQQSYIDALETRVSQLEERLDFTERLVSGRQA
jgi:hypothetical protein